MSARSLLIPAGQWGGAPPQRASEGMAQWFTTRDDLEAEESLELCLDQSWLEVQESQITDSTFHLLFQHGSLMLVLGEHDGPTLRAHGFQASSAGVYCFRGRLWDSVDLRVLRSCPDTLHWSPMDGRTSDVVVWHRIDGLDLKTTGMWLRTLMEETDIMGAAVRELMNTPGESRLPAAQHIAHTLDHLRHALACAIRMTWMGAGGGPYDEASSFPVPVVPSSSGVLSVDERMRRAMDIARQAGEVLRLTIAQGMMAAEHRLPRPSASSHGQARLLPHQAEEEEDVDVVDYHKPSLLRRCEYVRRAGRLPAFMKFDGSNNEVVLLPARQELVQMPMYSPAMVAMAPNVWQQASQTRRLLIHTFGRHMEYQPTLPPDIVFSALGLEWKQLILPDGSAMRMEGQGVHATVQAAVLACPVFQDFVKDIVVAVESRDLHEIGIYCDKGRHRSVAAAEIICRWVYPDSGRIHHGLPDVVRLLRQPRPPPL